MSNQEIAAQLKLIGQLLELKGENKFKVRSYLNAAFQLGRHPEPVAEQHVDQLAQIKGIGRNLAPKVAEIARHGTCKYLDELLADVPPGVVQMLAIKGLGPAKVKQIWENLGIESPGELLYACYENRLKDAKGFGEKTQNQVRKAIEFMIENSGKALYAKIEPHLKPLLEEVISRPEVDDAAWVGEVARYSPVITTAELLVSSKEAIDVGQFELPVALVVHTCKPDEFPRKRFILSSSENHLLSLKIKEDEDIDNCYRSRGFNYIPIEMREGHREFEWARQYTQGELITESHLKGCLHNHSTYSDGLDSLQAMAVAAREMGFEYFGICDHSISASYAGGLNENEITEQHLEIDRLNEALQPFRILKGIESDIRTDGSLDYPEEVLATFDFVVASVHSALKMDKQRATERLVRAIENPHTKILGHPTGRLLLSRPGYPLNMDMIIDACSSNGVALELNANPMRLDIDWRYVYQCMEKNVLISINPDAHNIAGLTHMRYGVMAARKGGLIQKYCLNALSLEQLLHYWNISG
ncbi:MAG: helix-hairpin-helix domain-containing protein [Salibacteraceae bacterium]